MAKIDVKDRKILYHLDLDAKQSFTQLGKKVGLKKDTVAYRVNKLQEEGVIKCFWTVIDTFKLGYMVFRMYFRFQYATTDVKNEIIQHFSNYRNAWAVNSVKGDIDLSVVIWVKNIYDFYRFWDQTLDKYGNYFAEKTISIYVQADEYHNTFLLPDKKEQTERKRFSISCSGKTVDIDETDYQLLNTIALNARIPLVDLSEKLDCSPQTVNYHLKNLIDKQVIQGFRVGIDISQFDLHYFGIKIDLRDHTKRKHIVNHLKDNPHFKCLNTAIGYKDLELELIAKNFDELNEILMDIESHFPNAMKSYTYWSDVKVHRERWLPEF